MLNFDIATDGTLNPLSIDNLSFDLTATAASGKVENIRLYSAAEPKEEALVATLDEGETSFAVSGVRFETHQPYSIYADVKPDVTGALAAPEVSALSVAGESRQVDASAVATLEIANSILIAADKSHQIYTVGDDVAFFDAGGADGNIPMNSEGTATFIPRHRRAVGENRLLPVQTFRQFLGCVGRQQRRDENLQRAGSIGREPYRHPG